MFVLNGNFLLGEVYIAFSNNQVWAQNGIGSNSCGPQVMEQYAFSDEAFRFELKLIPETV